MTEYGLDRVEEFLDSLAPPAEPIDPVDRWGTGQEAESGQNAMMRLLGAG